MSVDTGVPTDEKKDYFSDATEPEEQASEAAAEQAPTGRRAARQAARDAVARAEAAELALAAAQRREVHRLAAARLAQPGDLLDAALGGVELDALLDADGVVDPVLVRAAADALTAARPGLAAIPSPRHLGQEYDAGVRTPVSRPASWLDVLRGRS